MINNIDITNEVLNQITNAIYGDNSYLKIIGESWIAQRCLEAFHPIELTTDFIKNCSGLLANDLRALYDLYYYKVNVKQLPISTEDLKNILNTIGTFIIRYI